MPLSVSTQLIFHILGIFQLSYQEKLSASKQTVMWCCAQWHFGRTHGCECLRSPHVWCVSVFFNIQDILFSDSLFISCGLVAFWHSCTIPQQYNLSCKASRYTRGRTHTFSTCNVRVCSLKYRTLQEG